MGQQQDQSPRKRERKRRGRGEGSIYFDESAGRWCATVSRGVDAKGKRRRKKVTGKTKQEVQEKLAKLQQRQPLTDSTRMKLGDFLERTLEAWQANLAVTTCERRESLFRLHVLPRLGHLKLSALEPVHIEDFYTDMHRGQVPAATRRYVGQLLGSVLKRALKLGLIAVNPVLAVEKPSAPRKEMLCLTEVQARALLEAARLTRWYALLALALGTGMRGGEILALHWDDIDFDRNTLTVRRSLALTKAGPVERVPKTKASRRTINLPSFVVEALAEHRKRQLAAGLIQAPAFCARSGNWLFRENVRSKVLLPLLAKAGLPKVRFHDLRHTHASMLLSKGHSVKAVAARLGHTSAEMTLRIYAHVMPNDDLTLATGTQALFG